MKHSGSVTIGGREEYRWNKSRTMYRVMFGLIILLVCIGMVDASVPGATWTLVTPHATWPARDGHQALVFNNKTWVLGGIGPTARTSDVWNSSDMGSSWTEANASAWPARNEFGAVVFKNKMWVMGGFGAGGETNDIWYSSDGIIWTQEPLSDALWSPRAAFSVVVFNNKMWVLGGDSDGAPTNDVWYSDDGLTWTQVQGISWSARKDQQAVVFDHRIWVLGGDTAYTGSNPVNDVWYSYDGTTWTQATPSASWPARSQFGAAVFNNRMWVMGGMGSTGAPMNDVWVSTNGTLWTQATSAPGWTARRYFATVVYTTNSNWLPPVTGATPGPAENMLILGGITGAGPANDVWQTGLVQVPIILTILPQSPVVVNGSTTNYAVVLSAAPQGLSGAKFAFCPNNTVDWQIADYAAPPWAGLVSYGGGLSIGPGEAYTINEVDLTGSSGNQNITLGTFSLLNVHPGYTIINLGANCNMLGMFGAPSYVYPLAIYDRVGGYYNPTVVAGNFTVMTDRIPFPRPQPLGGYFPPPTDPNYDRLYEDLDGNGYSAMNDVVVMFTNLDDIAAGRYGLINYYDFDHSGDIGYNDIVTLYNEIR